MKGAGFVPESFTVERCRECILEGVGYEFIDDQSAGCRTGKIESDASRIDNGPDGFLRLIRPGNLLSECTQVHTHINV